MANKQDRERDDTQDQQERESQNARIGQGVIHSLGQPEGLRAVQVRRLWENHYRVNILVGADAMSAKIANSFFVQSDAEGNIIKSTPKISGPR